MWVIRARTCLPAAWTSSDTNQRHPAGTTPQNRAMDTEDHILIVDDDTGIRELAAQYLRKQGLQVSEAADGRQMHAVLARQRIDLVVLDLMLPGTDGIALCRALRSPGVPFVPIVMLTARSDEADRILGLELGADDYLTKPFAARELLARIHSVLRRTRMLPPNLAAHEPARELHFGHWRLDTVARHLLDTAGAMVALSGAEYRLLRILLQHPQRVLSRDQLLHLTQGREADAFDRSIDLLISRLRQRLRDEARESRYIKTVRNEGYVFCAEVRAVGAAP
jgi:two-component system OmpR family response regulator